MQKPCFATFWQGELSGYEMACINSFLKRGYRLTVYSYDPLSLPPGAIAGDAASIVAPAGRQRFIYQGKPNLQHFSDYFRYVMFRKTEAIWVDSDVLLLRGFDDSLPATVLARENQAAICNAVMRIDNEGGRLDRLIARTEAAMDRELSWGETGPQSLERETGLKRILADAFPAERFFAINHDMIWKAFLPAYAVECEVMTANAWGAHLFNNVIERIGIWKSFAPPKGSFLHRKWEADGSLQFFDGEYPVKVMTQLIDNWCSRQSGDALGIKQVTKQLVPSVGRTLRHYVGPRHSLNEGLQRLRTRLSRA